MSNTFKKGTVRVATVNGGAFLWDTGQNFAPFLPQSLKDKRYEVIIKDTAGREARAYLGGTGSGETLGSELVSNGNMETGDPPTGWTLQSGSTLDGVADERTGGGGVQCLDAARGTNPAVAKQQGDIFNSGGLHKITGWMKRGTATGVITACWDITAGLMVFTSNTVTATVWTEITGYFTMSGASGIIYLSLSGSAGQTGRFDDVSIKQVTSPPANEGVLLYSDREGSTQNFSSIDSGFLLNSVASYEVWYLHRGRRKRKGRLVTL